MPWGDGPFLETCPGDARQSDGMQRHFGVQSIFHPLKNPETICKAQMSHLHAATLVWGLLLSCRYVPAPVLIAEGYYSPSGPATS